MRNNVDNRDVLEGSDVMRSTSRARRAISATRGLIASSRSTGLAPTHKSIGRSTIVSLAAGHTSRFVSFTMPSGDGHLRRSCVVLNEIAALRRSRTVIRRRIRSLCLPKTRSRRTCGGGDELLKSAVRLNSTALVCFDVATGIDRRGRDRPWCATSNDVRHRFDCRRDHRLLRVPKILI
jgi:hypothetical protein